MKKILALAVTALLSLNANAAYVQYDFEGPISGYFIQHDTDKSIAQFNFGFILENAEPFPNFMQDLQPQGSEGSTRLTKVSTHFRSNGPTNFTIYSDFGADQFVNFDIDFTRAAQGKFAYSATYDISKYLVLGEADGGAGFYPFAGTLTGLVSKGTVDPVMARMLDDMGGYADFVGPMIPTFVPQVNPVPEPAGLALFTIGMLGALGVARRRSAK